jgi:hypothetical protein
MRATSPPKTVRGGAAEGVTSALDRVRQRHWSPHVFGFGTQSLKGGFRGTGAKFEEILVVTDSRDPEHSAFWLDDDLPRGSPRARSFERGGVRRWAEDE